MERKLKVNATSGYKYQNTPTLQVKGKYLEEFGFPIGTKVSVNLEQGKIVITPLVVAETVDYAVHQKYSRQTNYYSFQHLFESL